MSKTEVTSCSTNTINLLNAHDTEAPSYNTEAQSTNILRTC